MWSVISILIIFSFLNIHVWSLAPPVGFLNGRLLLPGKVYSCCKNEPYKTYRDFPVIYCYHGSPKKVINTWQTISALIDLSPEQYDLYEGSDTNEVMEQFETRRSSWSFNFISFRKKHIRLNPFNITCLGIQTNNDYTLRLEVIHVDYLRVAMFSFGVLLFFLSPSFAENPLFYYLTGISIGMLASVLILFYFILKLVPLKKPAMLGVIAGGSTLAFYLFQTFYENILVMLFMYQEYVLGYIFLSGLISFIVCYRFGPVSNPRSKNLIKWSLQVFSLILIFLSSHLQEVSVAAILIILSVYNIPIFKWVASFARLSKRALFSSKPKTRLLTLEEFKAQGEVETSRGLEELRSYCNSPNCRQWQTVLRLRDPHRFAKFMEGKSHLTRQEVEEYEEESKRLMDELLTDDSDED